MFRKILYKFFFFILEKKNRAKKNGVIWLKLSKNIGLVRPVGPSWTTHKNLEHQVRTEVIVRNFFFFFVKNINSFSSFTINLCVYFQVLPKIHLFHTFYEIHQMWKKKNHSFKFEIHSDIQHLKFVIIKFLHEFGCLKLYFPDHHYKFVYIIVL